MTDDVKNPISLDPGQWEEAFEDFPGRIEVVEHRLSASEYNEAAHFPRPIQQFHIVVERLDAVYALADGTEAPVKVYGGCDLEKKDRSGDIVKVAPGDNKATKMLSKFAEAKVRLSTNPEELAKLTGLICVWRRYRTLTVGGMQAKNVLYPLQVLAVDYKFAGEIQRFAVSAQQGGVSLEEAAGAGDHASRKELADALAGTPADSFDADLLTSEPFRRASGADKTALVKGDFGQAAVTDGLLKVEDGKFVNAGA